MIDSPWGGSSETWVGEKGSCEATRMCMSVYLGYDDDLKYVGGRGVAYRPIRGSTAGRASGWADGRGPPPGLDYYPGEQDRTPGNYRDASHSAHNSWWDNPGQTYQVARGAQGSFRTYTDVQRDRHGPRRNF